MSRASSRFRGRCGPSTTLEDGRSRLVQIGNAATRRRCRATIVATSLGASATSTPPLPVPPPSPSSGWTLAKDHPIAILATAVVATAGITWAAMHQLRVVPLKERLDRVDRASADPNGQWFDNRALYKALHVNCPAHVRTNEAIVTGRGLPGQSVEVEVREGDDRWSQGIAKIDENGLWRHEVRLGNPYGIDHRVPLPTTYVLTARERQSSSSCSIERLPEHDLQCFQSFPTIVKPRVATCAYAAGILATRCNPANVATSPSPLTLEWDREHGPLYVEVYRHGRPVTIETDGVDTPLDGSGKFRSGLKLALKPDLYELKLSEQSDGTCKSSAWVRVVPTRTGMRR
jgi:hypothetical protein